MTANDGVVILTPQNLTSPLPKSSDNNVDVEGQLKRGKWVNPIDFIMSMVAFAVGLGNVWRFPYLAHRYGGGTFLLVYSVYFVTVAVPMMVMEASIGQYLGLGATEIWKVFPILKGVGAASVVLCWWVTAYYHVIICWAIFYFISSIRFPAADLPWETCNNTWNDNCTCEENLQLVDNRSDLLGEKFETAASQFFERRVLQNSNSFAELRGIQWELVLIMVGLWILIYFCVWKSLIKARYFVWFSALFPYAILFAMLIRGAMLPGAVIGIKEYVTPNFTNLINPNLWKDAGSQIFFSYGVGNGGIISLGAYNDFNHNVIRDSIITCFINGGTSIIAGFAVYSTIGHMAQKLNMSIATLNSRTAITGPGLGFKIYPEAVLQISPKQLWSFAFFTMLCLLGLNSQVCLIEGSFSSLEDRFPKLLRVHKKKCLLLFCLFTVCAGQIMVTQAGILWLSLFDNFGAARHSLLFVAFFEVVGISWGFGAEKVRRALYEMRGSRPCCIWIILWKYCGPLAIGATFVVSLCFYPGISELLDVDSRPPKWVDAIGFLFSLSSMILIPGYVVYFVLSKSSGTSIMQRLREGITTPEGINKERIEKFSLAPDDFLSGLTTSTQSEVTAISSVP
ncbi:sodium:neurotransmitter symporter family domain-containing protein [Ditylenchus destructor]|uniref:Transporter n=1 Tax=Ditylenchus destructor TaxID=166010 RepID=A0AAD4RBJ3_9BILA|nr:sodium:neurotransmitter symporter family domain-containing protein [Ditylenchus destructor]